MTEMADFEKAERAAREACASGDPARIEQASITLDALERAERARRTPPSLGGTALWYAQRSIPVFPLHAGTKLPATRHGFKDATTDERQIRSWWTAWPEANIGLATGHVFDVFDIDGFEGQKTRASLWCEDPACREAGSQPHPPEWWTPMCAMNGHPGTFNRIETETIAKVITPRPGGMHLYVPATGAGNEAEMFGKGSKIDYRGLGGYVVAPRSIISEEWARAHDATPGTYRFLGRPAL